MPRQLLHVPADRRAFLRRWGVIAAAWGHLVAAPQAFADGRADRGADPVAAERADLPSTTMNGGSSGPPASPDASTPAEPTAQPDGYRWRGPPAAQPDWPGARRDAGLFVGYQLVAIAVLYAAPQSFTGWSSEDKNSYDLGRWRENVSNPVWDSDKWWINYVLHPYWGGTYYIRGRERGLGPTESFWYSALLSALWEYGGEALAEPVSIQDLIVTPVAGAIVGEYLFSPWRQRIRAKAGELDWTDKAVLAVTDPLGVVNAQVERWLNVQSTLTVEPVGGRSPVRSSPAWTTASARTERDSRSASGWGLRLRIVW